MIRILLIIALLFPSLSLAGQGMGPGPGVKTYGTTDYCTGKLGSYSLYYDADHPDSTTTACVSGGTTTVTLTASTAGDIAVSSDWNTTSGGTYGVLWNGTVDDFIVIPTASSGLATDNGRVELDVRVGSTITTGNIVVLEWGNSSSTAMIYGRLQYNATGYTGSTPGYRLLVYHYDGTSDPAYAGTAYVAAAADTTYHVVIDWSSTTDQIYAAVGAATTTGTATTITTFTAAGTPVDPKIGERYSGQTQTGSVGFDNILTGASQQ